MSAAMDAGEVEVITFDAVLPGYGSERFRMQKGGYPTLSAHVRSAIEHESGWLAVERDMPGVITGPRWVATQINVAHFAMLTEVKS